MFITVRSGKAYDQIIKFAEEIGAVMIMIGHRGLGAVERFFLGSVAAKVVANAPCSVYVHRPSVLPGE
jgi:nucleotide-binding universal stress UspA family protein